MSEIYCCKCHKTLIGNDTVYFSEDNAQDQAPYCSVSCYLAGSFVCVVTADEYIREFGDDEEDE